MGFTTNKITFGGYTANTLEVLEDALKWLKENPSVTLCDGILFSDEGHYLTLFYDVYDGEWGDP